MKAYRRFLTINDPRQLILANLPFQKGQQVEVVFLTNEEPDEVRLESLKNLFKTTQSLPQVQSLTGEEIAAEIELYRSGQ